MKLRRDLEEAFLHTLERNRKMQAQINLMRITPPRDRFRDHLVTIAKTWLPLAETQDHLDRLDRETRQVCEISDLQAKVISLHTRLQRQTITNERQHMQLSALQTSNSVLQSHLQHPADAEAVAEISRLQYQLAERTNQNNSLLAALDRERHMIALAEQPDQNNSLLAALALDSTIV